MRQLRTWLRMWPVWAIPAVLLVLNLVWVSGARSAVLGRGTSLTEQTVKLGEDCTRLEGQLTTLRATRGELDQVRARLDELRGETLSGMKERLVPFITEVVKLAGDAGVRPERVGYAAEQNEKTGLVRFSATYNVSGTYEQIRKLVFLLEASPEFVILEGLNLQGQEGGASTTVSVQLNMSTYFADMDRDLMRKLGVEETTPEPQAQPRTEPEGQRPDTGGKESLDGV